MDAILDRYIVDTLMGDLVGHDRRPSAFLVYLLIASGGERATLSYAAIAERTGLSRRACQAAVAHLERRGLIAVERRSGQEAGSYRALTPWRR